ncbi:MAG: FGGY-family carbohydrate kinase [Kiritimatiellia bacterium]
MILAYDFGTGGIKASLFDPDGRAVASGFAAYATHYPASGFREQAPEDWWRATVTSTRLLLADLSSGQKAAIRAIGISGHSLGVVPLDGKGKLLRARVPIWSDSRADAEAREFFTRIDERTWYRWTGCGFPPGLYSVFKLMWFRKHETDWFNRVDVVLGTKDYVNYRLTGVKATDNSYASGTGVYDLGARAYAPALIGASGLPSTIFPRILPATRVLGTLTAAAAAELGLPPTVQVVAGGVDNSCMALGAGAYREGRAYNSLGSSSWIAVSSGKPVIDDATRPYVFDHVVPGQYASALAIFSAGTSHTWLRDILGLDYAEMDALAEATGVGAHGLFFNPTLAGGSSLDATPAMRGAFANLDLRHTRGDLVRAVLEGVAFGLRHALDALRALVPVAEPLTLVGGGAQAPLWRQIYADVYGLRVVRTAIGQQAAALGAAVVAGVGCGLWPDFGVVERFAPVTEETAPSDARADYDALYARYRALAAHLGEWAAAV